VCLTLGILLTVGNYIGIVYAWRKHVEFSCIPILGGLFGCTGFLLLPRIRLFAFIPPLADPAACSCCSPCSYTFSKKTFVVLAKNGAGLDLGLGTPQPRECLKFSVGNFQLLRWPPISRAPLSKALVADFSFLSS
jgi:hypothetical protein